MSDVTYTPNYRVPGTGLLTYDREGKPLVILSMDQWKEIEEDKRRYQQAVKQNADLVDVVNKEVTKLKEDKVALATENDQLFEELKKAWQQVDSLLVEGNFLEKEVVPMLLKQLETLGDKNKKDQAILAEWLAYFNKARSITWTQNLAAMYDRLHTAVDKEPEIKTAYVQLQPGVTVKMPDGRLGVIIEVIPDRKLVDVRGLDDNWIYRIEESKLVLENNKHNKFYCPPCVFCGEGI